MIDMEINLKTNLDCIPCFLSQALRTSRTVTDDESVQRRIMNAVAALVPDISMEDKPPAIAERVYRMVSEFTDQPDPYRSIKEASNRNALALLPRMRQTVSESKDPLRTACKLAIAGNAIDFGALVVVDGMDEIFDDALRLSLAIDHYDAFQSALARAEKILILGDNAGEIVFDQLLVEQLHSRKGCPITYAVRERPIINDATLADAASTGLDQMVDVISNGSGAPGTILAQCSPQLRSAFEAADLIISKGQGNYESLSDESGPIFFFLKAKCSVIADPLNVQLGDALLLQNTH
jgi:damage-control phosphatase, subfamily I